LNEIKITLLGDAKTKKNSMQIVQIKGRPMLIQSKQYRQYEKDCIAQITEHQRIGIDYPVNMKCVYYRQTHRKVDLGNLLSASCDILVKAGVIADDNSNIVVGHDESRVLYDKNNPRVEITLSRIDE